MNNTNYYYYLCVLFLLGISFGTTACSDEGDASGETLDSAADTATTSTSDSGTATTAGETDSQFVPETDTVSADTGTMTGSDSDSDAVSTEPRSTDPLDTQSESSSDTMKGTEGGTSDDSETSFPNDTASDNDTATADSESETVDVGDAEQLTVHYEAGDAQGGPIVYVMWLENAAKTFVQNLFICNKLLDGSLTGTALPYWSLNLKDSAEIDGLSGATQLPEISVTRDIPAEATQQFTVYVELDHSWDDNDWFGDQPALLYAADIDLTASRTEYPLTPLGWTPESRTTFQSMDGKPSFEGGELCTEMRYITHSQSGNDFGDPDPDRSATNMVQSLTVRLH